MKGDGSRVDSQTLHDAYACDPQQRDADYYESAKTIGTQHKQAIKRHQGRKRLYAERQDGRAISKATKLKSSGSRSSYCSTDDDSEYSDTSSRHSVSSRYDDDSAYESIDGDNESRTRDSVQNDDTDYEDIGDILADYDNWELYKPAERADAQQSQASPKTTSVVYDTPPSRNNLKTTSVVYDTPPSRNNLKTTSVVYDTPPSRNNLKTTSVVYDTPPSRNNLKTTSVVYDTPPSRNERLQDRESRPKSRRDIVDSDDIERDDSVGDNEVYSKVTKPSRSRRLRRARSEVVERKAQKKVARPESEPQIGSEDMINKRMTMLNAFLECGGSSESCGIEPGALKVTFSDDLGSSPLSQSIRRRALLHARQNTREAMQSDNRRNNDVVLQKHVEKLPTQIVFNRFGKELLDGDDYGSQEAKRHKPVQDMRNKAAPLTFNTKQKRLAEQRAQQYKTQSGLEHLTKDERLLYSQLYEKLELIKCLRKLNFEKPIRIVYVDYDSALRHSHKGLSGAIDKRRGRDAPTALAKALLDTQYGMLLRANTIYVLASSSHINSNLYNDIQDLGIFDLCVSASSNVKMKVSSDTKLLGMVGCPRNLVGTYIFKQSMLEQLINVLRTQYNVPHVEVLLLDGSAAFTTHMETTLARKGVDGILSIDPNEIKERHVGCVLGKCNDYMHQHLASGKGDPRYANQQKCPAFSVVDRVITDRSAVEPYEYGSEYGISKFLSAGFRDTANIVLSVAMVRSGDNNTQKADITHRIRMHSMTLSDLFHNMFCLDANDF